MTRSSACAVRVLIVVALLTGCTATPTAAPTIAAPTTAARAHPPTTAAPATTAPTDDAVTAGLLARPMKLPKLAKGASCPTATAVSHTPVAQPADEMGLGNAPLWPIAFYIGNQPLLSLSQGGPSGPSPGPDGLYEQKVVWAAGNRYTGPVVVRVGRLDGPGRGRVKLYYDPDLSRGDSVIFPLHGYPEDYPSGTFVDGPGCWAYQLDGVGFTEVIPFRVTP